MILRMIRNCIRRPGQSLAVMLFAVVLTVVLCHLHQSSMAEQKSFEQTYASVPVTFRVTDLDGSKPGNIVGWIVDLFGSEGLKPNLEPMVGKLYLRVSNNGYYTYTAKDPWGVLMEYVGAATVSGIDSFYVAEELTENWGGETHWFEGYDESILATDALVCLVPESMKDIKEFRFDFIHTVMVDEVAYTYRSDVTLQVVGYYIDPGNTRFYCPYEVMKVIHAELGKSKDMEEVCAVLNDNSNLPQLREMAAKWFAEPNPSGEQTEWGHFGYEYYPYALDIDDIMLRNLEANLKSSIQLNNLASVVVFVLSAGAGFLTGFLVIRSRKREIALKRTMGTSHPMIFAEFALEQMLCVFAGIALGGSYTLWQPLDRLCLFGGIYFVGLAVALVIFLSKNLLTTIKEDE